MASRIQNRKIIMATTSGKPQLPTLTFHHTFSNGLGVTLTVRRDGSLPKFTSVKTGFQNSPEIMNEYKAWERDIAMSLVEDELLTEDEVFQLVLKAFGL